MEWGEVWVGLIEIEERVWVGVGRRRVGGRFNGLGDL
jgi:hypothetical protein